MGSPLERLTFVVWRLSNYVDLSGRGGLVASGRWHSRPKPIVYCSDEAHTAYCEMAKQFGADFLIPDSYRLLEIVAPKHVSLEEIDPDALSNDWFQDAPAAVYGCRHIGDEWLASGRSVLLKVPSAARSGSFNFLLNPVHRQADDFRIASVTAPPFSSEVRTAGA